MIELEFYKNENDPMNMNYLKSPVFLSLNKKLIFFNKGELLFEGS